MTGRADWWIGRVTTGCVAFLALVAGTVSYLHMHRLVELHGQPGWVAALTPLSADGMIVAASTTLLAESRRGSRGGFLPWALLVAGSVASLAANVAVAEPSLTGRVIAAWPSFALIASYELLMRQVRAAAGVSPSKRRPVRSAPARAPELSSARGRSAGRAARSPVRRLTGSDLQRQAWQWADANRGADGSLPSGRAIAGAFGRHERWGRLVKEYGEAGRGADTESLPA